MKREREKVIIEWSDSYGATERWENLENYNPILLTVTTAGTKVYEDDKVIAVASSYARETEYTAEQANGIMVIPVKCITTIKII